NAMLERERNNKLMSLAATAAAISHEMKQPLTAITANGMASLRLLQTAPPDLEEARSALNDVISDAYRAGQVLDNLRVLFGKVEREQEPIDVNKVAVGALRALRGEISDHRVAASLDLAPELPPVMGHGGQLQEVMMNLVHNAIDAMEAIKADRRILNVRTKLDDGRGIVVEGEDSGPGIDPKRLESIFDAFVTTKPQGTGLGLSICRMIIGGMSMDGHGGKLSARSNGRDGALLRLVLPSEPVKAG